MTECNELWSWAFQQGAGVKIPPRALVVADFVKSREIPPPGVEEKLPFPFILGSLEQRRRELLCEKKVVVFLDILTVYRSSEAANLREQLLAVRRSDVTPVQSRERVKRLG